MNIPKVIKSDDQFDSTKDMLSISYEAIESSVSGIIIADNNGLIRYVNNSFIRMFDYSGRAEIIGNNASDLFNLDEIKRFKDVELIIDSTKGETE